MKIKAIVLLFIIVFLSGCANTNSVSENTNGIQFTDSLNRTVTISEPKRVGIASGSLAECWILAGGEVCAVTKDAVTEKELDLPKDYINLGSLQEPSLETILAADLDFLILMSSLSNHVEMADTLEKAGIPYAYFDVENFDDYLKLMKVFTDITGRSDLYEKSAKALQPLIAAAIERGKREDAPTVLVLRTSSSRVKVLDSSFMVGGMLKEFGCVNIADSENSLLTELSMEAIVKENPDYIFISCMGNLEEGQAQLKATLTSNPIWNTLQAVQNDRVFYLEKELFHQKPNARWGESYEILAQLLSQ
ncbi:MAG: ABC transporter substrate-binding protein [Epulopiscium sp.]|jgi:iron complex transport system substrate-binding protein|nr:ABC transporter substrate-binding protein [Candidatus Epulonipiscium sp.]